MCKLACANIILLAISAIAQQPKTPPAAHSQHAAQPTQSADKIWADLMDGNQRFVTGRMKPEHVISDRKSLINEQHPKVMTLSCSDSRVPPE